jgi:hypothetical protein
MQAMTVMLRVLPAQILEIPLQKVLSLQFSASISQQKMMQRLELFESPTYEVRVFAANQHTTIARCVGDFSLCPIFQFAFKPVIRNISKRDSLREPPECCHLKFVRSSPLHHALKLFHSRVECQTSLLYQWR